MYISKKVPALAMLYSSFLTMLDMSAFYDSESLRQIFKLSGQGFLILSSIAVIFFGLGLGRQDRKKLFASILLSLLLSLPFLGFFISQLFNDLSDALTPLIRLVASFFLIFASTFLDKKTIHILLRHFSVIAVGLSLVGLLIFSFQLGDAERFPVIMLKSTKSIIFEQNLFSIILFLALFLVIDSRYYSPRVRLFVICLLLVGIFLSYFKTVIVLSAGYLSFRYARSFVSYIFLILPLCILYYFIDDFLMLTQVSENGLTSGRADLWYAAISIWSNNMFFGIGEASIANEILRYIQRTPPFTTFHNMFFDTLASSGLFGVGLLFSQFLVIFLQAKNNIYKIIFCMLPALFNSYFIAAPNLIGFFILLCVFNWSSGALNIFGRSYLKV